MSIKHERVIKKNSHIKMSNIQNWRFSLKRSYPLPGEICITWWNICRQEFKKLPKISLLSNYNQLFCIYLEKRILLETFQEVISKANNSSKFYGILINYHLNTENICIYKNIFKSTEIQIQTLENLP